jgi:hypothetical protein
MNSRRSFLRSLATTLVAAAVLVVPALAEELLGTVKSVDVEAKKIVVTTKGDDAKDVEITVNDQTEIVTGKGKKVALEKVKKDARVTVTHENKVASKIVVKGAGKKQAGPRP